MDVRSKLVVRRIMVAFDFRVFLKLESAYYYVLCLTLQTMKILETEYFAFCEQHSSVFCCLWGDLKFVVSARYFKVLKNIQREYKIFS